jgi:hypothetical protein
MEGMTPGYAVDHQCQLVFVVEQMDQSRPRHVSKPIGHVVVGVALEFHRENRGRRRCGLHPHLQQLKEPIGVAGDVADQPFGRPTLENVCGLEPERVALEL